MKQFSDFEKKTKVVFKDKNLLKQSFTHRSYINENGALALSHNERLEFLGDAVLEIVVTEHLYKNFPETPEGDLTNWRASLVNAKMLAEIASDIKLEDFLYLSKGEAKDSNSKARQYILANAIEALIGAIYLDQGIKSAKVFITKNIISRLENILENKLYMDPKSKFQEKAQEIHKLTPHYRVLKETGPDHAKEFEVGLYLGEKQISTGLGSSKQEAQVQAAIKGIKKQGW
jgi:ribonuclease-3